MISSVSSSIGQGIDNSVLILPCGPNGNWHIFHGTCYLDMAVIQEMAMNPSPVSHTPSLEISNFWWRKSFFSSVTKVCTFKPSMCWCHALDWQKTCLSSKGKLSHHAKKCRDEHEGDTPDSFKTWVLQTCRPPSLPRIVITDIPITSLIYCIQFYFDI